MAKSARRSTCWLSWRYRGSSPTRPGRLPPRPPATPGTVPLDLCGDARSQRRGADLSGSGDVCWSGTGGCSGAKFHGPGDALGSWRYHVAPRANLRSLGELAHSHNGPRPRASRTGAPPGAVRDQLALAPLAVQAPSAPVAHAGSLVAERFSRRYLLTRGRTKAVVSSVFEPERALWPSARPRPGRRLDPGSTMIA